MKLYEIDREIESCVDVETGEIIDLDKLTSLQMEREAKIENVVLWQQNLESDARALKEQEEYFKARRQQTERKAESLKRWIGCVLDGQPFETLKAKVTYRRSTALKVDIEKLPSDYWREEVIREPDNEKIKTALKAGKNVMGAWLEESLNPQINKARKAKECENSDC